MVNFSAGVVPVGKISPEEEVNDFKCYPDHNQVHKSLKKVILNQLIYYM